jgi:hypothetical protein
MKRRRPSAVRLPIAVRAYVPRTRPRGDRPAKGGPAPVLVFDTETTTDRSQRLLFGSYRLYDRQGVLRQEGIIRDDELSPDQLGVLDRYCVEHAAHNGGRLRLMSRTEFLETVFWPMAYRAHGVVVGFNLPFDLSRLAHGWRPARNGGFSLRMYPEHRANGRRSPHLYRPEISIKAYGPKRQFIRFTTPARVDRQNVGPRGPWRGRFVDCHTVTHALTDRSLSLDAAAAEFGLELRKVPGAEHGVVSDAYIDYNRQDVRVTHALYIALTAELARHPIDLAPEAAASPAAIAKAYLRAIGITPLLDRSAGLPERILGAAMTAYYGGRAEARIRLTSLPVRYVDFTSMYPTSFSLIGARSWLTAASFTSRDATTAAQELVHGITRDNLLDPALWPRFLGVFCRVRPNGELLPTRAPYGGAEDGPSGVAWTIGLNDLWSSHDHWFALADVVVAKLLGGRAPEILEAVEIVPEGVAPGLRPIALRGDISIKPTDDLFRRAIEERHRVRVDAAIPASERARLAGFLKTFANSGSYGIFAEYHQLDPVADGVAVHAYGLWPINTRVNTPEEPGEYCFPPLAASITAVARLLLAVLQAGIEARGGTFMACDTDSLSIVASPEGGPVPCAGGGAKMPDGTDAVNALSFREVDDVLREINRLNPYPATVVASLVKLEPENYAVADPPEPAGLHGIAISAKRYALYQRGPSGPTIRKASNHGLGLYRAPFPRQPDRGDPWPEWVEAAWETIIREVEGLPAQPEPDWLDLPAVSQLPVSSPHTIRAFRSIDAELTYSDQTKPFGFLVIGHVDPLVPSPTANSGRVIPVTPFETDATRLLERPWVNRIDGSTLAVTVKPGGEAGKLRLRTFRDVLAEYARHPEHKSGDARRGRGRRTSVGLLPRLRVEAAGVPVHIGKESNQLDEVEEGSITDKSEVYVEYRDERREWEASLPALRRLRDDKGWRHLATASRLSERAVRYAVNGGKLPRSAARSRLASLIPAPATIPLRTVTPGDDRRRGSHPRTGLSAVASGAPAIPRASDLGEPHGEG